MPGEKKILEFWEKNKIFEKSIKQRKSGAPFVFYDGPPFATGLPHYGHILASIIKDVIPRYQTMKGKIVPRRWGWDCHGLPIENIVEQELGLKTKQDIEKYGIEKFNQGAREKVLQYAGEWEKIIPRIGRWVDMKDDYKTMDKSYIESVWWVFKTLFDKGLIYEGYKSMHICPRCETTLSNFEVTQNYQDIEDIAVTVKFELEDEPGTCVLAWTTTPWTLPGNVALAVNPKIEYVKIKKGGKQFILAKNRLEMVKEGLEIKEEFKGKDLIGRKYRPLFNYYNEGDWKIYGADFVSTDEGTGAVHIAPAFGEEDMELGQKEKLPFIQHVTKDGKFKPEVKDFAGLPVKPKGNPRETDKKIVEWLEKENKVFSKELVVHSYPFCWRCETPLLNYAATSWFVRVAEIKDELTKNNKKINWVPGHLRDGRFGKWLENARDWAVSRSRYWGAPLPVWKCDNCKKTKVIGSADEIRDKIGNPNKLFLVRHAEAENNIKAILSSAPESDKFHLTEKGKQSAKELAEILGGEKIDLIFTSPLVRTQETAEIIIKKTKAEIIIDDRIKETDVGKFNGRPVGEFNKVYPTQESRIKNTDFGVESGEDIRRRMESFLNDVNKKYSNKNIVVVSHGDPLQIFYGLTQSLSLMESFKSWYPAKGSLKIVYSKTIDLHRPYIDGVEFDCSCGKKMKRVPEVFDCWFESGSMPYGQMHYPFENKKEFEAGFPAEFIAEGVDQTRGWFYTLLVLSTALFDKPAYKNVVANGIILAENGQKMSKRLKNYPDPMDIVEKYGADSLRYYLISSPAARAENINFSEKGVEEVYKKIILRLKNVLAFYKMYVLGNPVSLETGFPSSDNVLDKWILVRIKVLTKEITGALDKYELDKAVRPIADFAEDLSTWYIRRSRERFQRPATQKEKKEATATLHFVLLNLVKLLAPFLPFLSEEIYQSLKNKGMPESVHLCDWPRPDKKLIKKDLEEKMDRVREIVALALAKRAEKGLKVRQPLAAFKIKDSRFKTQDSGLLDLIKDEVNVTKIILDKKIKNEIELDTKLTPKLKTEGDFRELMRQIQDLRKKEGLKPGQKVKLNIEANAEDEKLVKNFEGELKKLTSVSLIKISKNPKVEKIRIKIEK